MIISEIIELNNQEFRHTFSDENFYIKKINTNEIYSDAYDLLEKRYEYIETNDKIKNIEDNINE